MEIGKAKVSCISLHRLLLDSCRMFCVSIAHSPQFVIPIFKFFQPAIKNNGGQEGVPPSCSTPTSYFNLYVQFHEGRLGLMTSVEAFKTNPKSSPPFAILSFFDELVESKGLVFVRCDTIAKDHLDRSDLAFCIDYIRAFYSDATLYKNCVEQFNHRSRDFDFQEFMRKTGPIRFQIYQGAKSQILQASERGPKEFQFC